MKTKIVTLLGIAIVICLVFLVAIPEIAADQTMQKVSASEVTTASEDDFALGVYGNANEDDTIDMRDLTYVKLIFFGKKPETELADAKYDGKINPLDFIQIKLIIVGKEKELTVVQYLGTPPEITEEPLTISMPIKRIVTLSSYATEALCVFDSVDKLVGVEGYDKASMGEIAEFIEDKEEVGYSLSSIDIEKVISLEPDIVISYTFIDTWYPEYGEQLSAACIPMFGTDLYMPDKYAREFRVLGWLLHNEERAEELIGFEEDVHARIHDVISEIPESEKPGVCYSPHYAFSELEVGIAGSGSSGHKRIVENGGINVFEDIEGGKQVSSEAVIDRNPDVFIKDVYTGWESFVECGYKAEDSSTLEQARDLVTSRTGWEYITAVENGDVYIICTHAASIHPCIFDSYIAKWLHPDRFKDLDPIEIHADWLDEFLGIPYKGVYAYPTPWTET